MNCPYCGCNLQSNYINESWYEKYCGDRCQMRYHQYFDGNFEATKLRYISFYTEHFHVYVYFENGFFPNTTHFYSNLEMNAKGTAMPVIQNLPASKIPTHELEELASGRYEKTSQTREWLKKVDDKLYTLALFA